MKVLRTYKKFRLTMYLDIYSVQYRTILGWRYVCFGPFRPYPVGFACFNFKSIAVKEFIKCCRKEYNVSSVRSGVISFNHYEADFSRAMTTKIALWGNVNE